MRSRSRATLSLGLLLLIVASVLVPRELPAQTPVGSEILVDGDSASANPVSYDIRVGLAADGSSVTTWIRQGVLYARLFRANGAARGPAITVTRPTARGSALSVSPDGSFVVVWPKNNALVGWRFDKNGRSIGTVFNVNATAAIVTDPSIARAPDGTFVVAWVRRVDGDVSLPLEHNPFDIYIRRFSATAAPLSGEVDVTPFYEGQMQPRLAVDALGRFALAYTHFSGEEWFDDIEALRLGTNAAPRGSRIFVNSDDGLQAYEQYDPEIAMATDGSFTVVWGSAEPVDDIVALPPGLYARQFHADGTPKGPPALLQGAGTGRLLDPAIARTPGNGFLLVWSRLNAAETAGRLLGRRFSAAATPLGGAFLVDAYAAGASREAALALNAQGGGVVVWRRYDNATRTSRVVLRRLAPPAAGP